MKLYIGTPSKYLQRIKDSLDASIEWTTDTKDKNECDAVVYIATPDLKGVGHIIEAVNDSNHWKEKTIFYSVLEDSEEESEEGFNPHQKKSLIATGKMVRVNGGQWFENEEDLKSYLNDLFVKSE